MEITCPMGCGIKLKLADLMCHPRVCDFRRVKCMHCQENVVFVHREEHRDVCVQYPLACPNNCGKEGIARRKLTSHLLECIKSHLACKHARLGCQYLGFGMELEEHEKDVLCHFSILADQFLKLHQSNEETKAALQELKKENETVQYSLQSVSDGLKKMQEQLKGLIEVENEETNAACQPVKTKITNLQQDLQSVNNKLKNMQGQLKELEKTKNEGIIAALQNVKKENENLKQGLQTVNNKLKNMQGQLKGLARTKKNVDSSSIIKVLIKRIEALEKCNKNAESANDF